MIQLTYNEKLLTIKDILYSNGHNLEDIQFFEDWGAPYVRIGYWERLSASEQTQLDMLLKEDCIDGDGDTLDFFFYWIE